MQAKVVKVEQGIIEKIDGFATRILDVEVEEGLTGLSSAIEGFERFFRQATPPSLAKKLGDLDCLLVGLAGLDHRSISRMIGPGKLESAVAVVERGIVAVAKLFVTYFDAVFKVAASDWDVVFKKQAARLIK